MTAKYFICSLKNLKGNHILHRENCPFFRDIEKSSDLGLHHTTQSAINTGKMIVGKIEVCRFCCKDYYDQKKKQEFSKISVQVKACVYKEIKITRESALKCSIN